MSGTRARTEWRAQEIDWVFLGKALPHGACCYGIDQAAKRSKQANMLRLKRGCLPGPSDFYIFYNNITVWLERKVRGGSLSEAQRVFRDAIIRNGGHWAEVRSVEDVENALTIAGIPLRATVAAIRERIEDQRANLPTKRKPATRAPRPLNSMSLAAYRRANAKGLL